MIHENHNLNDPNPLDTMVDIVVPVHNGIDMTRRFLDSLRRFTDFPFHLILVDNGSADLPDSLVEGFEKAQILRCGENLGYGGGCNQGIRAGASSLVAVLNNDLILTRGWLNALVEPLLEDSTIGATAPCTNYAKGQQEVDIGAIPNVEEMHEKAEAWKEKLDEHLEDVPFATGMCLVMRRDVLDRTGYFDERFEIGNFEDNDLCLRLKMLGMRIVLVRNSYVYHLGNRTFQTLDMDYEGLMRANQERYREKWNHDPFQRGLSLEQEGDLAGALKSYLTGVKAGGMNPEPLFQIGLILLHLGRNGAAERSFRQYLQACPQSTRAMIGLGTSLCLKGETGEGTAQLRKILDHRYVPDQDREKLENLMDTFSASPSRDPAAI